MDFTYILALSFKLLNHLPSLSVIVDETLEVIDLVTLAFCDTSPDDSTDKQLVRHKSTYHITKFLQIPAYLYPV